MNKDVEFTVRYVAAPSSEGPPYEFLLEYSDAAGTLTFEGREHRDPSGGFLYFLSQQDWDAFYPARKGQRELIKGRLLDHFRSTPHLRFLERSLQHDALFRHVSPGIAGLMTGAAANQATSSMTRFAGALARVSMIDLVLAVAIATISPVAVLLGTDPLAIGLWYYLALPAVVLGIGVSMAAPPPFLTASSMVLAASLLFLWRPGESEDWSALRHLLSVPLALICHVGALKLARRSSRVIAILALALVGWGGGFLSFQWFLHRKDPFTLFTLP